MGQCCGFVKTDTKNTINTSSAYRDEQQKEIEKVIKNMEEGEKKNALLKELNNRHSLLISKHSYQDIIDIQHKIYEGPNKGGQSKQSAISKDDIHLESKEASKIEPNNQSNQNNNVNADTATGGDNNNKQNESLQQNNSKLNSKQNNNLTPSKEDNDLLQKKKSSDMNNHLSNDKNDIKQQQSNTKIKSKENVQLESQQQQQSKQQSQQQQNKTSKDGKSSNNNNNEQGGGKDGKQTANNKQSSSSKDKQINGQLKSEKKNSKDKNGIGLGDEKKNVGFNIEDIEREMKKESRGRNRDAQTDIDNETTKTENKPKGVLKKYSDVQSCYTKEGGDKPKKKKVKFKDPQKPKKKVAKRQYH